ncbi:efflux RND transporter periplasmic adaptor subunit [Calothrix rhizosoleniae]|uniref:efflux RND transporter periplasmic adaptor subunit n=1 Tax=Calothrix rhizosoleniae TaxID=888997 RepID=UPI000B49E638|nr:efflux RND transporter periplasmic adaptor subunit [Calothrix rhizosoleniae]
MALEKENFSDGNERESDIGEENNQEQEVQQANKQSAWLLPMLLGTCFGFAIAIIAMGKFSQPSQHTNKAIANQISPEVPIAMTVTTVPVETTRITRNLNVTGTVSAQNLIPVLPQANGLLIKKILVSQRDYVKQGQVLAVLDDSILQGQISQAKADVESKKADVASSQADLASKQAAVTSSQAIVQQRKADLAQEQARLLEAEKNFLRYQKLGADGAISQQELDTRETTVKTAREAVRLAQENIRSAQANVISARADIATARASIDSAKADVKSNAARLQQLKTQLAQTLVRAPVAGIIAEKLARVGDVTGIPPQTQAINVVGGTQKLFSIISNSKLELRAEVPAIQLSQIKIGAEVKVTSDANSQVHLRGKVREIEPIVNENRREAIVRIDLPSTQLLKLGMFARAAINTNTVMSVAVPQKAILPQPDGSAIAFTLSSKNIVNAQKVEMGEIINGGKVEIKSGLQSGEQVVIDGAGYLKDGDKVKVISNK